jgi:hypothetical protein
MRPLSGPFQLSVAKTPQTGDATSVGKGLLTRGHYQPIAPPATAPRDTKRTILSIGTPSNRELTASSESIPLSGDMQLF